MPPSDPSATGGRARVRRWLPAALWAAIIFVLSSQSSVPGLENPLFDRALNVLSHGMEFGLLALLLLYALTTNLDGASPRHYVAAWVLTAAYALTDEVHQAFVPFRHADPLDWLVDVSAAGLLLAALWLRARGGHGRG